MATLGLHANHLKRLEEFQTAQGQQQFEHGSIDL
jgi:DNA processing protein